jgi:tetratricopeptide (TPR) repeat protein
MAIDDETTQDSELATDDTSASGLASPATDPEGVLRLARYPILRKLGEGGMGVVYACYDEALDRRLAIKLLNSRFQARSARARLEREAQALARLSHPNVVHVYEIGSHRDSLYLAMEFVDGQTLRAWLREAERSWQAIVGMFLQAGAGLAAAHAVGLIHRDFKPENVMVGRDGRARVLDFGLVRQVGPDASTSLEHEDELDVPDSRRLLDRTMTRPGTIMGTPAYMAPEQLEGRACDARTDQFAFCVVAHEALFGIRRPEPGSADPLGVPRRVRAAIVRGLAEDPGQRWPDLQALLDELARALAGPRRRWLGAASLVFVSAVAAGVWAADESPEPTPPCAIDESALAGVWDEPRRASVRAAFMQQSNAEPTLRLVETTLDVWSEDWLASQRAACEATHVQGSQSPDMLDKRTACLDRQRRTVTVLIDLLTEPDAELVARTPELLASLPDLDACADAELVEVRYPLPEDPEQAEAIATGFDRLARARALARAGRLEDADELVDLLAASNIQYPPLDLEVRALIGERRVWHGELDEGLPLILDAARAAEAAHLDDLVASLRVDAAIEGAGNWGIPEQERGLVAEAEAALSRVGRADDPRRIDLHQAHGWLLDAAGDYAGALAEFEAAATLARRIGRPVLADLARVDVARMLVNLGRHDEAAQEFEAAREAASRILGPGSPRLADIELDIGLFAAQRGRFDEATEHLDRARSIYVAAFGERADQVTRVDLASGKLALTSGDLSRAGELFERVAASNTAAPEWQADAHEALGVVRFYAGDFPGSLDAYARALELRLRVLDAEHPKIAILHSNIGESKAALGDHEGALTAYSMAITTLERRLPADHFDLAFPLKGRGQSRLALGDAAAAQADLERALALHEANPGEPLERADVEFSSARALAELGEVSSARALAEHARDRYLALDQPERAAAIDRWLAQAKARQ